MERSTTNLNSFFKVMMGNFQERLRIPDAFLKRLSENLTDKAIIEGPSGGCWHVKVNMHSDGLYFEDGWATFASQHSLTLFDFLVFSYNGDVTFNVKIFDRSACEREDAYTVNWSQDAMDFRGKKKRGRPTKGDKKECRRPLSSSSENHEEDCNFEQEHSRQSDKHPFGGHGVQLPKSDEPVKKELMDAKAAASSFTSQFPYFVTRLKAYNVRRSFWLHIPAAFAKAHLPLGSTYMSLQNNDGNSWRVKVQNDPRHSWFYTGWKAFSNENILNEGDYCAFELVDRKNLRVHIIRVGDPKCSVF